MGITRVFTTHGRYVLCLVGRFMVRSNPRHFIIGKQILHDMIWNIMKQSTNTV